MIWSEFVRLQIHATRSYRGAARRNHQIDDSHAQRCKCSVKVVSWVEDVSAVKAGVRSTARELDSSLDIPSPGSSNIDGVPRLVTDRGTHHVVSYQQTMRVVISPTGIGIAPESTDKIFKYGSGTKSQVSGFGQHECTNYVIASNGSVKIESDRHL
jgi:hypothetical protein